VNSAQTAEQRQCARANLDVEICLDLMTVACRQDESG